MGFLHSNETGSLRMKNTFVSLRATHPGASSTYLRVFGRCTCLYLPRYPQTLPAADVVVEFPRLMRFGSGETRGR